ncbi:putative protease SohB [bacterium MnTg02]|nr:putative protease SohB [bacterium MnTg02]
MAMNESKAGVTPDTNRKRNLFKPWTWRRSFPVVPVLRFSGAIGVVTPLRPGLTLAATASAIERAFSTSRAKAVAVLINSPGGSPVQSMLIYKRIRALSEEKGLPVYVFMEDVAASGGYLLALAGDEIYADPSSIVGSIGVISASFGFDRLIKRYDIDRRVYTAGEKKMTLDSFSPEQEEDVARLKVIQKDIHGTFIDLVKERRGKKIEQAGDMLFTGEFWSGTKAVELGLVDGLADVRTKMRELYGEKVRLKLVTSSRNMFRRLRIPGMGWDEGGEPFLRESLANDVISAIEARALWSRYGL